MSAVALTFFAGALATSALDWLAVVRRIPGLEYVCKPAAALLFCVSALTLDASDSAAQAWLAAALAFCILGDIFLMLPKDAFVQGLGSFAVAQVLFTVSFAVRDMSTTRLVAGVLVVAVASIALAWRFIRALKLGGHSSLIAPIIVYMTVISAMAASSIGSGTVVAVVGAVLFMASDSLIAEERFVAQRRWQPLTIIVTYHLALAGLVLGLVR